MITKTKRLKEIIDKYAYLLNTNDEVCIYESYWECFKCSDKNINLVFENGGTLSICECKDEFIERLSKNDYK